MASGTKTTNSAREILSGMLADISLAKQMPDAPLELLVNLETQILEHQRSAPIVPGDTAVSGPAPSGPPLGGGGPEGMPPMPPPLPGGVGPGAMPVLPPGVMAGV